MARQTSTGLSKGILSMKFMVKSKDKREKHHEEHDGVNMYDSEVTALMKTGENRFITEKSRIPCDNLLDGRFSFGGVNPEIERLMNEEIDKKNTIKAKENETVVSDLQMANYSKFIANANRKFDKRHINFQQQKDKRHQPISRNKKFLKPVDT